MPTRLPRLRTLLLEVGLLILLLPLAAIVVFRVWDDLLVRQAQSELVAQGAALAAAHGDAMLRLGRAPDGSLPREWPVIARDAPATMEEGESLPVLSVRRSPVLPPAANAVPSAAPADPVALAAGEQVGPLLVATSGVTLAGIRIVDRAGIVVASSRGELGMSLVAREEVPRALAGETVALLRERVSDEPRKPLTSVSRNTRVRVFVAMPVVVRDRVAGAIVLSRTPLSLGKAYYRDRHLLLAVALGLLGAVPALMFVLAAFVVRPIHALVRQAETIASGGDVTPAIARPGTSEVAQLSEAMARMATALRERSGYIRDFTASVSHEFKTPLASMQATIELLRDHLDGMTEAERTRFLDMLDADAKRLGRLVQRLMELARADMSRPGTEAADVAGVLGALRERLASEGRVILVAAAGVGAARIPAEALDAVLSILVDNAFVHGGPDVQVRVEASRAGDRVDVRVIDDGPGISEANAPRVFDAFFTTARDRGGTGMGLTIARSIARAHGGMLELEPRERGTCARLNLEA